MLQKVRGYEYRNMLICVDSYDDCILNGRFYHTIRKEGTQFKSLMQLFLKVEDLLNTMDFPQSFAAVRTFSRMPELPADGPPEGEQVSGKAGTFEVRILFRQNASWQGSITWLEGGRTESFRSALEFSMLMDSALNMKERNENTA